MGTIDGKPAKIRYLPDNHKTEIFWGGIGKPDGFGKNHAVIYDAEPDAVVFLRQNGRIIVDTSAPSHDEARRREATNIIANALRFAWRVNRRWWRF
jgi:hypothetical protein